jgi:hypothetical protein
MTPQEVYDTVRDHLLTQNARSMNNAVCVYRSPNGLKCAIGCLIRDDEYFPEMEGEYIMNLGINRFYDHEFLLDDLRELHDNHDPSEWKRMLIGIAYDHGLEP